MRTNRYTTKQKVIIAIIVILCLAGFGVGIYYSILGVGPIQKIQMREYYQDDTNYYSVCVRVENLIEDHNIIEFSEVVNSDEFIYLHTYYRVFAPNMYALWITLDLNEGDVIEIISAKRRFWDAYILPIVAIKKDGVEYLSFEDGKAALFEWLNSL